MGYKRKVRVVFVSEGDPALAPLAVEQALTAADWLEARAANAATLAALLDWADLVVTLDTEADAQLPVLPGRVQHRHYPVEHNPEQELRQRIACMVGGLQLMERAAHE
jgi:hypothetical protein